MTKPCYASAALFLTVLPFLLTGATLRPSTASNGGLSLIEKKESIKGLESEGASSLLQRASLFAGQIIGGRRSAELGEDITEDAISAMTDCIFYKQEPGRCYPTDPTTPCRYCKEKAFKFFGSHECPGPDSFPPELQSLYEWRLKPITKKKTFRQIAVCIVHPLQQGPTYAPPYPPPYPPGPHQQYAYALSLEVTTTLLGLTAALLCL